MIALYLIVVVILIFFGEEGLLVEQINGLFDTDFTGIALFCIGLLIVAVVDLIFRK